MGDFVPPDATRNSTLFGWNIQGRTLPFLVCTSGIFLCYCLSSLSQEYLYALKNEDGQSFHFTSSLTLWCKLAAVGWGAAGGGLRERKAPHSWHAGIGFLTFATMWLSNQSLLWLNYPTQTLFKSAKLIPVMLGSMLINGTRFHVLEYLSALGLLVGLVSFTMADVKVSPRFDPIGVGVICIALAADAVLGNFQEKMFKSFGTGAAEMMTYSNGYAALLSLLLCMLEGETIVAAQFILSNPTAALCAGAYAFLNILGIYFVLLMIARFGATLTTFTTSLRKALTVVLSFVLFPKPFAWGYALGSLATAVGIALNMRASSLKRVERERLANLADPDGSDAAEAAQKLFSLSSEQGADIKPLVTAWSLEEGRGGRGAGMQRVDSSISISTSGSPALPTTPLQDASSLGLGQIAKPAGQPQRQHSAPERRDAEREREREAERDEREQASHVDADTGGGGAAAGLLRSRSPSPQTVRGLRVDAVLSALASTDSAAPHSSASPRAHVIAGSGTTRMRSPPNSSAALMQAQAEGSAIGSTPH